MCKALVGYKKIFQVAELPGNSETIYIQGIQCCVVIALTMCVYVHVCLCLCVCACAYCGNMLILEAECVNNTCQFVQVLYRQWGSTSGLR